MRMALIWRCHLYAWRGLLLDIVILDDIIYFTIALIWWWHLMWRWHLSTFMWRWRCFDDGMFWHWHFFDDDVYLTMTIALTMARYFPPVFQRCDTRSTPWPWTSGVSGCSSTSSPTGRLPSKVIYYKNIRELLSRIPVPFENYYSGSGSNFLLWRGMCLRLFQCL